MHGTNNKSTTVHNASVRLPILISSKRAYKVRGILSFIVEELTQLEYSDLLMVDKGPDYHSKMVGFIETCLCFQLFYQDLESLINLPKNTRRRDINEISELHNDYLLKFLNDTESTNVTYIHCINNLVDSTTAYSRRESALDNLGVLVNTLFLETMSEAFESEYVRLYLGFIDTDEGYDWWNKYLTDGNESINSRLLSIELHRRAQFHKIMLKVPEKIARDEDDLENLRKITRTLAFGCGLSLYRANPHVLPQRNDILIEHENHPDRNNTDSKTRGNSQSMGLNSKSVYITVRIVEQSLRTYLKLLCVASQEKLADDLTTTIDSVKPFWYLVNMLSRIPVYRPSLYSHYLENLSETLEVPVPENSCQEGNPEDSILEVWRDYRDNSLENFLSTEKIHEIATRERETNIRNTWNRTINALETSDSKVLRLWKGLFEDEEALSLLFKYEGIGGISEENWVSPFRGFTICLPRQAIGSESVNAILPLMLRVPERIAKDEKDLEELNRFARTIVFTKLGRFTYTENEYMLKPREFE